MGTSFYFIWLSLWCLSCLLTYTCWQARQQWKLLDIVIQHKLGACPIKHVSIAIVISSEHRKDSLEAVSFVIDELKKTVPIWKRVSYAIHPIVRRYCLKDWCCICIDTRSFIRTERLSGKLTKRIRLKWMGYSRVSNVAKNSVDIYVIIITTELFIVLTICWKWNSL